MSRPRLGIAVLLALAWASAGLADVPPGEAYVLHCSGCHGPDGSGQPGFIPSLRDLDALLSRPGGRAYLGRVPGVAQAPVDDARLAALLNWVLEEIANTTDFDPYRTEEVGILRSEPLRAPLEARP